MKKVFYIILISMLFLSFNVKADDICYFKVDNNCVLTSLEDYSTTGTTGTITYNNTTKLITFNNYTGPGITIDALAETVTVKFIGDNIINTPYVVTRDYSSTVIDNLIINGEDDSTLTVNSSSGSTNYLFMGLYQTSLLQVNNMHIYNNSDCGVISSSSNLTEINDSYIESLTAGYTTIDSSYGLIINNVEIHSSNDASVTYRNPVIYSYVYLEIYDSKIYASNRSYLTYSSRTYYSDERDELNRLIIENSEFYGENITEGAIYFDYVNTATIKNNIVQINNNLGASYFAIITTSNTGRFNKQIVIENNIMESTEGRVFYLRCSGSEESKATFNNNILKVGKSYYEGLIAYDIGIECNNTIIDINETNRSLIFESSDSLDSDFDFTNSIINANFPNDFSYYYLLELYAYNINIDNSIFNLNCANIGSTSQGLYINSDGCDVNLNNSLINVNGVDYGVYFSRYDNLTINSMNFEVHNYRYGIYTYNPITFNKSFINLEDDSNRSEFGIYSEDLSFINSKAYINLESGSNKSAYGIYNYGDTLIDHSNINISNIVHNGTGYTNTNKYGLYLYGGDHLITDSYLDIKTDIDNGTALYCSLSTGNTFTLDDTESIDTDGVGIDVFSDTYSAYENKFINDKSLISGYRDQYHNLKIVRNIG